MLTFTLLGGLLFRKRKYAEKNVPTLAWTAIALFFSEALFLVSSPHMLKHPGLKEDENLISEKNPLKIECLTHSRYTHEDCYLY